MKYILLILTILSFTVNANGFSKESEQRCYSIFATGDGGGKATGDGGGKATGDGGGKATGDGGGKATGDGGGKATGDGGGKTISYEFFQCLKAFTR